MRNGEEERLRHHIGEVLSQGLKTQTEPFPETQVEFAQLLSDLRKKDPDDLEGKLDLAGFTDKPYGPDEMRCLECMYYLVHRK